MVNILLVDDQKVVRERMKLVLEKEPNFKIIGAAANGLKGIELAAKLAPDIILMDLEMPYLNGLMATKLICQQNIDTNILILTSQKSQTLFVQALNAGAKGYLLKSSDVKEIISKINLVYRESNLAGRKYNQFNQILPVDSSDNKNEAIATGVAEQTIYTDRVKQANTLPPNFVAAQKSKLDLFSLLTILKRRYPPALMGFIATILGAIIYLLFAQKMYQATALIILEDSQESISELGKDLSNNSSNKEYSSLASQAKLIGSKPILNAAIRNIAEEDYSVEELSIVQIKENLSIKVLPNTNILEVNYEAPDPEFSALMLNEIIDASIDRNVEIIQSEARSVRQFLEKEVRKQQKKLDETETAENRYREEKGIVALDNQTEDLVTSLNDVTTKEQDLLAQIKEQEAKVNSLQQIAKVRSARSAYSKGIIGQNEQLERLRTQLTDIEEQLATARANFTDSNPTVIALLEKRTQILELYQRQVSEVLGEDVDVSPSESTKNEISQEVISELITTQAQLEADRAKLETIRAEKARLAARISALPANVRPLTALVRQREQVNESLQFLQRKLEEARIAEAQLVSHLQIVELATPPLSPSSPQKLPTLAIASVVGLILATGIILLLEKLDRTLYEGREIEQQLNIPLLSDLPRLPGGTNNLLQIQSFLQNEDLYEPYRILLKRIESSSQQKSKVVVVTSAIAGEGKSVVASHLGAVSAMLSQRTLIIDAHLNRANQHNWFDVRLQPGLTEIVTEGLKFDKVVQPTKIDNLSVLSAGRSNSNSCMVIESPLIATLIEEAMMQYDLVIIDAPAVSSNCDAYTLSKYSHGLMMVTRPLHTTINILEQTVTELSRSRATIIGFVINNAERQKLLKGDRHQTQDKPKLLGSSQTDSSHGETSYL